MNFFYCVDREVIPKGINVVRSSCCNLADGDWLSGICRVLLGFPWRRGSGGGEQVPASDATERDQTRNSSTLISRPARAAYISDHSITSTGFLDLFHPAITRKCISYSRQASSKLIGPNTPNSKQTMFDYPRSAFPLPAYADSVRVFFLTLACCRRLDLSPGFLPARFHDAIDGVPSHQTPHPT